MCPADRIDTDEIEEWAIGLARAVAPREEPLAPDLVIAYLAGGEDRADLFRRPGAVPGGFSGGDALALLPVILEGIASASTAVLALLASEPLAVPSAVNDTLSLIDRVRASRARRQGSSTDDRDDAQEGDRVGYACGLVDALDETMTRYGVPALERDALNYRTLRYVLESRGGSGGFAANARRP